LQKNSKPDCWGCKMNTRIEAVLSLCGLKALPPRTLVSFQDKARPNKFYPIRFPLPKGFDLKDVLEREEDWVVLVIEFENERPSRWAKFQASDFRITQWVNDRGRMSVSVVATQVARALVPVAGDGFALLAEPGLKEWMVKRNKEKLDEV